jgi:hypothetical protein
MRRFLPELIDLIWNRASDPRSVFDLTLPLDPGRRGLPGDDESRAIKTLPLALGVP